MFWTQLVLFYTDTPKDGRSSLSYKKTAMYVVMGVVLIVLGLVPRYLYSSSEAGNFWIIIGLCVMTGICSSILQAGLGQFTQSCEPQARAMVKERIALGTTFSALGVNLFKVLTLWLSKMIESYHYSN